MLAIADGRVPIKKIVTNMFQFPNVQEALDACGVDSLNAFFSQDDCFDYWGGSARVFDGRHHYWTDEELGLDA